MSRPLNPTETCSRALSLLMRLIRRVGRGAFGWGSNWAMTLTVGGPSLLDGFEVADDAREWIIAREVKHQRPFFF